AEVHIAFADLVNLPGAEPLTDAWLRGRAGEAGWLLGKDAEAAGCDALISPIVTAAPDWSAITEMVLLVAGALGEHGGHGEHGVTVPDQAGGRDTAPRDTVPGDGDDGDPGRPSVPLPPDALPLPPGSWQALAQAMGRLAIRFVSGPGAIASLLRTGLLPQPFAGKSIPLDVGFSQHVPEAIRRAVIARAGGYCEWPGGCDVPAAASDVHHIVHKADGGPTSVAGCGCFCGFHHLVCIHRWGWKIELLADGAFQATSPDGTQVIRGHPARGHPARGKRPPPSRAA
ncbi:MAG: HNH endonuclease, partial [Nocardiopsaceae bacterium]|nr:HNH endonuclease [Nocardiopsaceae bacterium]